MKHRHQNIHASCCIGLTAELQYSSAGFRNRDNLPGTAGPRACCPFANTESPFALAMFLPDYSEQRRRQQIQPDHNLNTNHRESGNHLNLR